MHKIENKIIMVGPDPEGLGGISRVIKLWMSTSLFKDHGIAYIVSTDDSTRNKFITLLIGLVRFSLLCFTRTRYVYIHTASRRSFYRKSLFIMISILFSKKIILHIHPSFFFAFLSGMNGVKKRVFFSLLNQVDRFIVLTKEMHENLSTLFPHKPIHILPNPVNIREMQDGKQLRREQNRVLYLGWYNRLKGVYDLVDAISLLKAQGVNITTDFYGTKEIEQLRVYVKEKGLDGCINVHGWANNDQKIRALKQATMLVLPSHTEGIPNVILEAMAAKIPIVATLVGGLRDILRDRENAIIAEPGNPKDLSEKILICLTNQDLRNMITEQAFLQAKKEYDLPTIAEKVSEILQQIRT